MAVTDRWHKAHPKPGEQRCREHRKVPSAAHGQGKRWQARYRDDTGRQKAVNFARLTDAEAFGAKVQRELATAGYMDPVAGKVTLREYAERRWLPSRLNLRPGTARMYGQHLRGSIYPALGNRPVASLRKQDIQQFVQAISTRLAPATVKTCYAVLRSVLASAVDDRLIVASPCRRVALPRIEKRVIVPLEQSAIRALHGAMVPRYRLAVLLAAMCGLREGEVLGLTVPCVDFLRRQIKVQQQLQDGALVPPKSRSSVRTVPADDVVLMAVTEHMRMFAPGPGQLVIVNSVGRPVQGTAFRAAWRAAVKGAGLPAGTRFHDLRHYFASVLIAANLNPKVIQERLGHASISETMDTYGHLFPDAEALGRGVFDAMFSGADVQGLCTDGETG